MAFFLLAAAMGSANPSGLRTITANSDIVEVTAGHGTEVKFSLTKLDQTISSILGAFGYASSSLASGRNEDEQGEDGEGKGKGKISVSEPPTLLLLGIALLVIAALRFRRVS
jgi:hypothetical protein